MKDIKKVVTSIVVAVALVFPAHSAFAVTEDSSYEADVAEYTALLGNKITTEQMDARLQEAARNADVSKEELVKYQIAVFKNPEVAQYSDRSGGSGTVRLRNSIIGDYFYTDTNPGNWGHVGIYVDKNYIVEAQKPGLNAHIATTDSVKVLQGRSQIMRVRTSPVNRQKAAARARTYIGRGYNAAFFNDTKNDWGGLMCSQLVWASYYYGAGIELDTLMNDNIVWPIDLKTSKMAYVVQYM